MIGNLFTVLIPARVAYGLMILGLVFGFIVGMGGNPWCLAVLPLSAMGFVAVNRRNDLTTHKHIWDVWQHCELSNYEYIRGERTLVLVKGQMRDCLSCGERQVKQVSA